MSGRTEVSYSSEQCQKCPYASNCEFVGQKESLEKKLVNHRIVRCQADANKYIEDSLKKPLP